jgi:hypothetical protein
MWTAEETQEYLADVLAVPVDDLVRSSPPDLPSALYCFGQVSTGAIHSVVFPDGESTPIVTTLPVQPSALEEIPRAG